MTRIEAGTRVARGYYFSGKSWSLHPVQHAGEALPGTRGEKYLRIPLPLAFVLGPLMGALFLMFLPFIGFYLAGQAATRPVSAIVSRSATSIAATLQPGWRPGQAHLSGNHARASVAGAGSAPEPLAQLEREIAALRRARSAARS